MLKAGWKRNAMDRNIGAIKLPVNRLHIELTNVCNFSCAFCPDSKMKREKGYISIDMAKSILDEVSRTGIVDWVFFHVMGEPTLHPKLAEIVGYAKSRGINVCITTNGSRLDHDTLGMLTGAGVKKIILSLQTPDEQTFSMRGARELSFADYEEKVTAAAREFISKNNDTELVINFLSSPLRRLIVPIAEEFSIADTTGKLRDHLTLWAEKILSGTPAEKNLPGVFKQIRKARSFGENSIRLTGGLSFHTRIVGDWATHSVKKIVRAKFGYCPGIQENFGILWNGDYVFCCTDYEGRTAIANYSRVSIAEYLENEIVQKTVRGFQRFRVLDPHCQICIGDPSHLNSFVKQIGSVLYFKLFKRLVHS